MTVYANPPLCEIRMHDSKHLGYLYIDNERTAVLLNILQEDADLGPLKPVRKHHILPEANITVIPRKDIAKITVYDQDIP
jgi:hypothetical protein